MGCICVVSGSKSNPTTMGIGQMPKKKFQPRVGESFQITNLRVEQPLIRYETILFTLVLFAMIWLGVAGFYGLYVDDFTYLGTMFDRLDKYFVVIVGGLGVSYGRTINQSEFSNGQEVP